MRVSRVTSPTSDACRLLTIALRFAVGVTHASNKVIQLSFKRVQLVLLCPRLLLHLSFRSLLLLGHASGDLQIGFDMIELVQ
jgi:hypothetical protein